MVTQTDIDKLQARLISKIEQKGAIAQQALSGLGYVDEDMLDGLGFSLKKLAKKATAATKHAVKVQVNLVKKTANIAKLAVTDPEKAIKETVKLEKSAVRNAAKQGKDIAPYAAVAAAVYFGGPAAWQYLSTTGASGFLGGAAKLLETAGVVQSLQAAKMANPNISDLPPDQLLMDPTIQQAATGITGQVITDQTGYTMTSPDAQQLTAALAAQGTQTAAAASQQPPSKVGAILTYGVPLAILAKLFLI